MKTLLYIFLLMLIGTKAFCQSPTYFKAPELKNLQGEWIGINNTDTFRIILQYKERYQMGPNLFVDGIFGWHSYSENGFIKSKNIYYPLDVKNSSIVMGKDALGNLFLTFSDKASSNGTATISFKLVPGSTNQAIWKTEKIIPSESTDITFTDKKGNAVKKVQQSRESYPKSKITSTPVWIMKKVD